MVRLVVNTDMVGYTGMVRLIRWGFCGVMVLCWGCTSPHLSVTRNDGMKPASLVLTATERRLFADLVDTRLDSMNLIEAGLIASGVGSAGARRRMMKEVRRLRQSIKARIQAARTQRKKAAVVYKAIYDRWFRRYHPDANHVGRAIRSGSFNCVSATILFNGLLASYGIRSQAVFSLTHVYSVIYVDGQEIEVETTSRNGFEPFRSRAAYRAFLAARGLNSAFLKVGKNGKLRTKALIFRRSQAIRRMNNPVLLGFLYANRAVQRAERGDRQGAWQLLERARRAHRGKLYYAKSGDVYLHNLALGHLQAGRNRQALRLLLFAKNSRDENRFTPAMGRMMGSAFNRLISKVAKTHDIKETERLFSLARRYAPQNRVLKHNYPLWISDLARHLFQENQARKAVTLIRKYMALGSDALSNRWAISIVNLARRRAAKGQGREARAVLADHVRQMTAAGAASRRMAFVYHELGRQQYGSGMYTLAVQSFRAAIKRHDSRSARYNLGLCFRNLAVAAYNRKNCTQALKWARAAKPFTTDGSIGRIEARCGG